MEFLYWAYIGGGVFVIVAFLSLMVYAIKTISSSPLIPDDYDDDDEDPNIGT